MISSNPLQGTAQWLADRQGCLTASRIADILDVKKDGKPGAKYLKLLHEIAAERVAADNVRRYVSPAMEWGVITEPEARSVYEDRTGNFVRLMGFVRHAEIDNAGASPDGAVGHDGLIEIKCPTTITHMGYVRGKVPPDEYIPQMTFQLACTRRKWVDFVSYDPRINIDEKRLFVVRFEPDPAEIAALESKAREFLALVDQIFEEFVTA